MGIVEGTPRWAVVCAWATVACVMPSSLWRVLVGLGVPLGWSDKHLALERIPGFGTAYVITLSVLSVAAASLTLGLVQSWGEVLPRWIPALGGRRVPVWFAIVVALVGAAAVTQLVVTSIVNWSAVSGFAERPTSGWAVLMLGCYLPATLWPVLLLVTLAAYVRRRTSAGQRGEAAGPPRPVVRGAS